MNNLTEYFFCYIIINGVINRQFFHFIVVDHIYSHFSSFLISQNDMLAYSLLPYR